MGTRSNTIVENIHLIAVESYAFRYGSEYAELIDIVSCGNPHDGNPYFHGCGLGSGLDYTIEYAEVDLKSDKFYKLVEVSHGY